MLEDRGKCQINAFILIILSFASAAEGTNNRCIIEVKKTTSKINDCYDKIKLDCYTDKKNPGNLKYELGLFIKFIARKKPDSKTKIDVKYIECYTNGENNNDLENYFRELLTHNG